MFLSFNWNLCVQNFHDGGGKFDCFHCFSSFGRHLKLVIFQKTDNLSFQFPRVSLHLRLGHDVGEGGEEVLGLRPQHSPGQLVKQSGGSGGLRLGGRGQDQQSQAGYEELYPGHDSLDVAWHTLRE